MFSFRWTGAALACAVMGFPLMVRAIRLSIEAVDRRLEAAAATLGAMRAWVFLTVTLPLTLPGIIAGMILCFAKAMGEFGATITFVSNIPGETQTLPSAIYSFTQVPGGDAQALRLTAISVAISLAALMASELLAGAPGRRSRHEPDPSTFSTAHGAFQPRGRLRKQGAADGGVRRVGLRQDDARQRDRRAGAAPAGADRHRRQRADGHGEGHRRAAAQAAASAMCFRMRGCFRI